ncbi:MAG: protein kinase, partial [Myxococcota bacterium]
MSNQDLPVEDERTDSVPKAAPTYADDEMRTLGDRLAALYDAQAADPGAPVADEIARIRARMRKGPRLRAGEFLKDGRYRLIERSRTGSADGYWKAWDRVSADLVLVRVFHGDWVGDPTAIARFKERGDQLEQLVHPNIGGVLDADRTDDGFVYVAATYFTSGDLAHAQLDATDAIQVSLEVAQALRHAHEHGVVHGDVRPSNVMLSADGSAHLVGFSIEAKAPEATSVYRAPEATEDSYVPAAPADVYALGMTALAALHRAELPFWVLRDPSRLIRGLAVGETVKAVLTRATDWDLGVRYPTISALLDDWLSDHELVSSLAVRARARGRHPIAAQHYEKLLEIQPGRGVEIRTILGDVYMAMGAYDRAMTHLLAALERTSDVEALFAPLRIAAEHTGDWSKLAEALWTQARARDAGRRVVLRIELAKINFDKLQNPVASAETWSQVLADHRTPDQAVIALRSLCDLAKLRQDWVGFTEYSQELLEYVPEDERSRIEYAIGRVFLEHLSDETRGLEFIDRAEAVGYTELELAPRMQGIRAKRGQWKRVIQLMVMQAATQDIGEASPTLLRAGIIASAVHLEEEAFTVYHALLERAPKHVVALRHVARLHHRAHEQDKALRYYERLWETYKGKDSEEPEASERAADCTA